MTPERVRQIEDLYHAACENPGVLSAALPDLRHEVESLLAYQGAPLPPLLTGALLAPEPEESLSAWPDLTGEQFGPYRIDERLGAGGMGVVFRAFDTRLNRLVAIKFISNKLANSSAAKRFEREVRLASSLNHPHILTVYDTGELDGRPYLVTEFIDGGTLGDWYKREKRSWRQIVELLAGVADGLAAAHRAGIVHRDIKPANILVGSNGYAKLGDFGLAKLSTDSATAGKADVTEAGTQPGHLIGTIHYLSPEQAQSCPPDERSDLFSFGIVLYELLSGVRPFTGITDLDLLTAIVHAEPEPLPGELPLALRAMVAKTLEKDPADRYQTARDLVVDLRRAARQKVETPSKARRLLSSARLWSSIAVGGVLVLAAFFQLLRPYVRPFANPLADATFTRLTDYEGSQVDASISPDGKFVSFLSDQDGRFHVWLVQVGAGAPVNLTPASEDERAPLRSLGFAQNGLEIWLAGTETRKVRLLPLVGGEPRVFLGKNAVNPVWSPDGKRLAYHTSDAGDPIFVADAEGANPQEIFKEAQDRHNHYLTWAADGQWIYFVHGTAATGEMDLCRVRPSGGAFEQLTSQTADLRDPTPLGPHLILYVARDKDGSGPFLWAYDARHKISQRITIGLEQYTSLSASADGRRLAATVSNPKAGLWTVPIRSAVAEERDVVPVAVPALQSSAPRYRGNALYYLGAPGAGQSLWRSEGGKTSQVWRGNGSGSLEAPAISPDGRHIAVVFRENGKKRLRLISADGSESSALAPTLEVEGSSDWSPDGRWIVTGGNDGTSAGLFKVSVANGTPVRLTNQIGRNPIWSPDGSLIAYSGPNVFTLSPLLAVRPNGRAIELPAIRTHRDGERIRFLPDGHGIVYMQGEGATPWQDFWLLDLTTMKTRRLTRLSDRAAMRTFDLSPDGKRILFDRRRENSLVVLITRPLQ